MKNLWILFFIISSTTIWAQNTLYKDAVIDYVTDSSKEPYRALIAGCSCATPCGSAAIYTSAPASWSVESPRYAETPVIAAHSTSPIQCFTFTANNTSENIDMGSLTVGFGCGFSKFNWTVYDVSCTLVGSGNIGNTTVSGLTCGNNYVLCLSFKSNCDVDSISPYLYNGNCSTFPITLVSFDAAYNSTKQNTKLTWETASEISNKEFTIERTGDGENWEDIATIPGAGNSDIPNYYFIIDQNPIIGTSYYRLEQTDYDGHSTYSDIVVITIPSRVIFIPTYDGFTLNVKEGDLTVYDMLGRQVYNCNAESRFYPLQTGFYIVSIGTSFGEYEYKMDIR